LRVAGDRLRIDCASLKKVQLQPVKSVRVKIVDQGNGVANAQVRLDAGSYEYQASTDSNGIATFKIPERETVFLISAWTDDRRVAGLHVGRIPSKADRDSNFELEVSSGAPIKVRAIDEQSRPVPDVILSFTSVDGEHGEHFVGENAHSQQKTNADGEVLFEWV